MVHDSSASRARHPAAWLGVILVAGLAMRVDRLGGRSFWFDEGFSWKLITFPWREMVARVAMDNHAPLYFLLLKLWANAFGDSAWSLRLLSVLMGEATILGVYLMAREAYRGLATGDGDEVRAEGIGLLSAALVAASTFHILWSNEVRMYTLGTALAASSGWLLLRALGRPGWHPGRWLAYAVATALFAYTHAYATFSIAAQASFALGYLAHAHAGKPGALLADARTRGLVLAYGLAFALWSPWLPVLVSQRRQVGATFWLPPMSWWLVAKTSYQMFAPSQYDVPTVGAATVAALACAAGFAALLRRAGPGDWFVFVTGLVPFAVSGTLSSLQFNIWHRQYFLFAHLSFLMAIAVLVSRARSRAARRALAMAVMVGFVGTYSSFARTRAARSVVPGARAAAVFLDGRRAPGEQVVVCSPMMTPCIEGHSRDGSGWRTFQPAGDYPHYMGTAVIRPGEYVTPDGLERLAGPRAWVVDVERWEKGTHIVPVPAPWALRAERRFPEIYGDGCEIIVREYELPTSRGGPGPR